MRQDTSVMMEINCSKYSRSMLTHYLVKATKKIFKRKNKLIFSGHREFIYDVEINIILRLPDALIE